MKSLALLSFLLGAALSEVVQHPMIRIQSKREKMIAEGTFESYSLHRRAELFNNYFTNGGQLDGAHQGQNQKDIGDVVYVSRLGVGTPPQFFHMIMDTGSSNCWFPGKTCGEECESNFFCHLLKRCDTPACAGCPSCQKSGPEAAAAKAQITSGLLPDLAVEDPTAADPCAGKAKYDSGASSTAQKDGRGFSIQYGTGSCSGYVASDLVSIGGPNNASYLPVRAKIGVATHLAAFFANQPLDGICGLAFPSIAVDHLEPWFFDLMPQLDLPLFTVWFNSTHQEAGAQAGLITYGAYDTQHCAIDAQGSGVNWVPLSSATYWQFKVDAMAIGGASADGSSTPVEGGSGQAISDTGTSLFAGPSAVVKAMGQALGGTYDSSIQGYKLPCAMASASGPTVDVTIGGKLYSILPRDYVIKTGAPDGSCQFAAQAFGLGFGGPKFILGDTWIRSHCNVYDVKNKRIGFAKVKDHNYPPNSN